MYVYVYVYVYVSVCALMNTRAWACVRVCVSVYMYMYVYICICILIYNPRKELENPPVISVAPKLVPGENCAAIFLAPKFPAQDSRKTLEGIPTQKKNMKEFLHKKLSLCTSNQVSNQENHLEGIPTQKNMAEGIPTLKMSGRGPVRSGSEL